MSIPGLNWLFEEQTPEGRRATLRTILWGMVLTIAWMVGLLPGTDSVFVRADDVEEKIDSEVKAVVAEALKPLKQTVEGTEKKVDTLTQNVEGLTKEAAANRRNGLEQQLFALRKSQCEAIASGNKQAMAYYGERITHVRNLYYLAAGYEYPLPTCAELGA